ncbi:MAG: homoserine dehydrogenase [Bernardetiaceae bacterium]|nr:homoserine dehydrogenase [Bernardetiaceae bacterium]
MIKIGLFGFGAVGQGLYDIFTKTDFKAEILKICVKHKHKKRSLDASFFTFDKNDILQHEDINLIVELIDDADAAFEIVSEALKAGKKVVTANKKMVAQNLETLLALEENNGGALLYEAAVCGSIPIIRTLAEYYDNESLYAVRGIFNGSSNYILSKTLNEGLSYEKALQEAQELGFAETDPTLDVGGFDALYKLCITTAQACGAIVKPEQIFRFGIQHLNTLDTRVATEKNRKIKSVATLQRLPDNRIALSVMPHWVSPEDALYNVEYEYNAVIVEAAFSEKQTFVGKGAGGHPTGSAVLSDISASRYDYKYEYRKKQLQEPPVLDLKQEIEIYLRYESEAQLERFDFNHILVRHQEQDFKYVIGKINLSALHGMQAFLNEQHLFLAQVH